jgi:hypothetical protein
MNVIAHHCNIREMSLEFFRQFGLVIMALDNIEARYHHHLPQNLREPDLHLPEPASSRRRNHRVPRPSPIHPSAQDKMLQLLEKTHPRADLPSLHNPKTAGKTNPLYSVGEVCV